MRDRVLFRAHTLADVRQADYACAGARRTATGTPHRVAHTHASARARASQDGLRRT